MQAVIIARVKNLQQEQNHNQNIEIKNDHAPMQS